MRPFRQRGIHILVGLSQKTRTRVWVYLGIAVVLCLLLAIALSAQTPDPEYAARTSSFRLTRPAAGVLWTLSTHFIPAIGAAGMGVVPQELHRWLIQSDSEPVPPPVPLGVRSCRPPPVLSA
jgi:hypothetical protein